MRLTPVLLGLAAALLLGGCIGTDPGPGDDEPLEDASAEDTLPPDLTIEDGETTQPDATTLTYTWQGTVEAGATFPGQAPTDPVDSTTFEMPADMEFDATATLSWDHDEMLHVTIENQAGFKHCRIVQADGGEATCNLAPTGPLLDRETWTVTVRPAATTQATSFELEITLNVLDTEHEPGTNARESVVVAIPDSGINPYHDIYHRPNLTDHPCTYIEGFPCSIPALNLSLDADSYEEALDADEDIWKGIEPGDWYWIPQTPFVAVHCESAYSGHCILDEHGHGTGTTSSVLMENPNASIAFKEGGSAVRPFEDRGIPVDVYSVSWGHNAPLPTPGDTCIKNEGLVTTQHVFPFYVKSAGNAPGVSSLADCWASHPSLVSVGGAYAEDQTQETTAYKEPDVVSYYCRPTADIETLDGMRDSYCGTSFSGPTVAGALSKVILDVREHAGYTGTVTSDGVFEPDSGLSHVDLRDALNRTATYDPDPKYDNTRETAIPLNPEAPWMQWGWGFYDGLVAEDTTKHLLGIEEADPKPEQARTYMESLYTARETLYGTSLVGS